MIVIYQHLDAAAATPLVDQFVAVYLDVYADDVQRDQVFYGEGRFRRQITGHLPAPRWEAVTADIDGEMIGFAYGFSLTAGSMWWSGLLTEVPEGFTTETGHRTFALSELMVRKAWRGQGVARHLHDELLAGRHEERATLFALPDNSTAQAAYLRWGWKKAALVRPNWLGSPTFDVLMLPLQAEEHSSSVN
jgi:GNAT superfamily N-acetyltransferase